MFQITTINSFLINNNKITKYNLWINHYSTFEYRISSKFKLQTDI